MAALCASSVTCAGMRTKPTLASSAAPSCPLSLSATPLGCRELLPSTASLSSSTVAAATRRSWAPVNTRAGAFGVTEGKNVLIINTNSGGHAVIGFWLAKRLRGFGHSVMVLTVGEEDDPKMDKPPFTRFSELREVGVKTLWGYPSDISAALGPRNPFDVVIDNNGKDMAACKPAVDWAQAMDVKQYLFVSSAGIYKTTYEPPHLSGDAVKEGGHAEVEQYIASKYWPQGWSSFRPQYLTGSGNNKDCEEWFFDRIVRNRPIPIPAPGIQLTVITHAADIADIIVSAVNDHEAAAGQTFNAVSGRAVTFDGLVRLCAKAAGMEPDIVHYDPKEVGVDAKKAFPFRNQHFFAESRLAKSKLGWSSVLDLKDILDARFEEYVHKGRYSADLTFELDDKILAAVGRSV